MAGASFNGYEEIISAGSWTATDSCDKEGKGNGYLCHCC